MPDPRLWSLHDPHLYTIHTEVSAGKNISDSTQTKFGIRTIRFDAENGFFLNDERVQTPRQLNNGDVVRFGEAEFVFTKVF